MFAEIAPSYDRLNRLFSGALDTRWRASLAGELTRGLEPCRRLLDVATGTGDVARALERKAPRAGIVGADFTRPMLERAREKFGVRAFDWIEADGLLLPFASGCFDGVSISFGLRNMADRRRGLAEMARVVRPGGRVAILEFSQPRGALLRRLYDFYSFAVMPRLGRWMSGTSAYLYLSRSIREFWSPEQLAGAMREAGLERVRARSIAGGIVYLHVGEKPDPEA